MSRRERRKQQKAKQRRERIRRGKAGGEFTSLPGAGPQDYGLDDDVPSVFDTFDLNWLPVPEDVDEKPPPYYMERVLRWLLTEVAADRVALDRVLDHPRFPLPSVLMRRGIRSPDAAERAQELAYRAMEQPPASEQALLCLNLALRQDPDCLDAQVLWLLVIEGDADERVRELQQLREEAERRLGPEAVAQTVPDIWFWPDARPYLRLLAFLAGAQQGAGHNEEAARLYRRVFCLQSEPELGAGRALLWLCLSEDWLDEADGLLERLAEEYAADVAWSRVLALCLRGDLAGAEAALCRARLVEPALEGPIRDGLEPGPADGAPGDGTDGVPVDAANGLHAAWSVHPDALAWFAAQAVR